MTTKRPICSDDTLRARFEAKVVRGDSDDECWSWTASKYPFGYGCIGTSAGLDGAHRVSYRLNVGPIPDGLCVLHRCDNPECSNPRHLFLGDKLANAIDRHAKGRGKNPVMPGEAHPNARISAIDARAIRESAATCATLAREYALSTTQIARIRSGARWKGAV